MSLAALSSLLQETQTVLSQTIHAASDSRACVPLGNSDAYDPEDSSVDSGMLPFRFPIDDAVQWHTYHDRSYHVATRNVVDKAASSHHTTLPDGHQLSPSLGFWRMVYLHRVIRHLVPEAAAFLWVSPDPGELEYWVHTWTSHHYVVSSDRPVGCKWLAALSPRGVQTFLDVHHVRPSVVVVDLAQSNAVLFRVLTHVIQSAAAAGWTQLSVVVKNVTTNTVDPLLELMSHFQFHAWITPPWDQARKQTWCVMSVIVSTPAPVTCCESVIKSIRPKEPFAYTPHLSAFKGSYMSTEIRWWATWPVANPPPVAVYGDWRDADKLDEKAVAKLFHIVGRCLRPAGHQPSVRPQEIGPATFQWRDTRQMIRDNLRRQPVAVNADQFLRVERDEVGIRDFLGPGSMSFCLPSKGVWCALYHCERTFILWPDACTVESSRTALFAQCVDPYCPTEAPHTWWTHLPSKAGLIGVMYDNGQFVALDLFMLPENEHVAFAHNVVRRQELLRTFVASVGSPHLIYIDPVETADLCDALKEADDRFGFTVYIACPPEDHTLIDSGERTWMMFPSTLPVPHKSDRADIDRLFDSEPPPLTEPSILDHVSTSSPTRRTSPGRHSPDRGRPTRLDHSNRGRPDRFRSDRSDRTHSDRSDRPSYNRSDRPSYNRSDRPDRSRPNYSRSDRGRPNRGRPSYNHSDRSHSDRRSPGRMRPAHRGHVHSSARRPSPGRRMASPVRQIPLVDTPHSPVYAPSPTDYNPTSPAHSPPHQSSPPSTPWPLSPTRPDESTPWPLSPTRADVTVHEQATPVPFLDI